MKIRIIIINIKVMSFFREKENTAQCIDRIFFIFNQIYSC